MSRVLVGRSISPAAACTLGVTLPNPAAAIYGYLHPPNDVYYTLIRPQDCAGTDSVRVTSAEIVLFSLGFNCVTTVTLSLVGATGAPECPEPDDGNPLVVPAQFMLPSGSGPTTYVFTIEGGFRIAERVFLSVTFDAFSPLCAGNEPLLVTEDSGCEECTQWNRHGAGEPLVDLCTNVLRPNEVGGLVHYVTAESLPATAIQAASWGSLKVRYVDP